jgi:predicted RNA polymerase sigma factor
VLSWLVGFLGDFDLAEEAAAEAFAIAADPPRADAGGSESPSFPSRTSPPPRS